MSQSAPNRETEIKLRAPEPRAAAELLTSHGFSVSQPRVYERNGVFDDSSLTLRTAGKILRVREAGEKCKLTFKGKGHPGRHKVREEIEVDISDAKRFEDILSRLGYERKFVYEKYRTEFEDERGSGTATLDETPIGTFFELEGDPVWIDETARRLGFQGNDYLIESYAALYLRWCEDRGVAPGDMVWASTAAGDPISRRDYSLRPERDSGW